MTTNHNAVLLDLIIWLLGSSSNLFLLCYFGQQATDSFGRMSDALYETNWLNFEPKLQKYFLIAIQNAQQPLFYNGFSIMTLNLESYTQVSKWMLHKLVGIFNRSSSTGSKDSFPVLHDVQGSDCWGRLDLLERLV